ncbi:ABC transporter permease [Phreatobacter oligotrophus]|jgi:peptide/nickel transport system permease protein|uniref:Peptide/nickel transport system permease protein n=1 Tax=Phreatobacter oligotrophus TaxID=1122261 RepID=A0A2T4YS63_9HYPH|nr:ABC transporter permease [Phreatobacter oligotrophus]PTM46629.1 peptide/nickel transport system permease protein [Phreatobacter oligotrophus]
MALTVSCSRSLEIAAVVALAVIVLVPQGSWVNQPLEAPFVSPRWTHPFGSDDLGRDMLAMVLQGLRTSLLVGLGTVSLALALGVAVGTIAGLASEIVDDLLMRLADIVQSLPTLLLAILVAAMFGGSVTLLILVLGLTRWPLVARLVRVETRALRSREFVLAAVALGASTTMIVSRHILPHVATIARAATAILFGGALVSEAALAFVGLGDPSATSLGQLAARGFQFVTHAPWMWFAPVSAICGLAFGVALISERLGTAMRVQA